jgi:hypothetical protein
MQPARAFTSRGLSNHPGPLYPGRWRWTAATAQVAGQWPVNDLSGQCRPLKASGKSWCHALAGWSPSPDADNKSHTDCLQAQGAQTMTVSFNNFDSRLSTTVGTLATNGYAGCSTCAPVIPADPNYITHHPQALSDIMVNKLTAAGVTKLPGNWNVYGNRFSGADVPINAGDDRIAGAQLGRLCQNVFAGDAAIAGQAIWVDPNVTLNTCDGTPEANTFMTPVPVKRNA